MPLTTLLDIDAWPAEPVPTADGRSHGDGRLAGLRRPHDAIDLPLALLGSAANLFRQSIPDLGPDGERDGTESEAQIDARLNVVQGHPQVPLQVPESICLLGGQFDTEVEVSQD